MKWNIILYSFPVIFEITCLVSWLTKDSMCATKTMHFLLSTAFYCQNKEIINLLLWSNLSWADCPLSLITVVTIIHSFVSWENISFLFTVEVRTQTTSKNHHHYFLSGRWHQSVMRRVSDRDTYLSLGMYGYRQDRNHLGYREHFVSFPPCSCQQSAPLKRPMGPVSICQKVHTEKKPKLHSL